MIHVRISGNKEAKYHTDKNVGIKNVCWKDSPNKQMEWFTWVFYIMREANEHISQNVIIKSQRWETHPTTNWNKYLILMYTVSLTQSKTKETHLNNLWCKGKGY